MSVTLRPLNDCKRRLNHGDGRSVNISNGHWAALVEMAFAFGEAVSWNHTHDGAKYTPDQLRKIAERLDQIKDDGKWLRWLADNGGAKLS